MYMSWLGLAVVMPLFWLVALAVLRQLDKLNVPLAVAVPVAWVALEYCRMHFPTGFPFMKQIGAYQMIGFGWYYLGYTQHAFSHLIQIADLGGVYAVSFVVASVNGLLAGVVMQMPGVRRALRWEESTQIAEEPTSPATLPEGKGEKSKLSFSPFPSGRAAGGVGFLCVFGLVIASVGYGFYRLDHAPFAEGPVVSAIQGNVSQDDKMSEKGSLFQQYAALHLKALNEPRFPDLIVWPETCCPLDWYEVVRGARAEDAPAGFEVARASSRHKFLNAGNWDAQVLLGLNGLEWDGEQIRKYNSALLLKPVSRDPLAGPSDPVIERNVAAGRYDKMHLVPFGEYVPLGDVLPFMQWFTPYPKSYECKPGEKWTRFPISARNGRDYTFGCLICYEDSDPYLARQYVASEPVNFLVNISNDGWFNGTEEHEEHLAICRFRAIEARRSVVRSVNMGISGVIDADGRIVALPDPDWSKSKKTEAVVTAVVPIDNREPIYAKLGDWVPGACWVVAVIGLVVGFVRRPSSPSPLAGEGGEALRAG
jgi:apolipoprotein N-acyltransferase